MAVPEGRLPDGQGPRRGGSQSPPWEPGAATCLGVTRTPRAGGRGGRAVAGRRAAVTGRTREHQGEPGTGTAPGHSRGRFRGPEP